MAGFKGIILSKGQLVLTAENTTVLTTIGQHYQINGTFVDSINVNFITAADGTMTYNGPSGQIFAFNGVSDLKSDKAATVNYTLFINGVAVSGATTPHTFNNANSYDNISITNLITLTKGDVLTIRAKSDTATTTLTVYSLLVNFIQLP